MSDKGKDTAMEKAIQLLSEQYDTVQIICTTVDEEGDTEVHHVGSGNIYGRVGSVGEWINERNAMFEAALESRVNDMMKGDE